MSRATPNAARRRFLLLGRDGARHPSPGSGVRMARVSGACLAARGTICRSCSEHCEPQAIRFRPLRGGRLLPRIDQVRCNACGECVRVCPAQAMSLQVVEAVAS